VIVLFDNFGSPTYIFKKFGNLLFPFGKLNKSKLTMDDLFSVKGKVALITGSTSGLGKAFAVGLARRGAIL